MVRGRSARAALGMLIAALLFVPSGLRAGEAGKTIKIGVVYDLTGPFAGGRFKFEHPGESMSGQNERAYPVIVQYSDDQSHVVWPKEQQQREPVLKLPASSPYALK